MANAARTPLKIGNLLALGASSGGLGVAVTTLTGTLTMTAYSEQLQKLNGGVANRDVVLPVVAAKYKGVFYVIHNAGTTNDLVVKDAGTTLATLNPGEAGIFACTAGTSWVLMLQASSLATDIFAANGAYTGNNTHSGTETFSNAAGVTTDVITERSAGVGVTADGVLLKDGHILDSVGFYDAAAPTKIARIDAGAVTAGQTRVIAMADANVSLADVVTMAGAGAQALDAAASPSFTGVTIASALNLSDGAMVLKRGAGTGTGDLIEITGPDATHGWATYVYEATVAPAAIETALFTVPAESEVLSCQGNVETALTGGGTTVTWGFGITGDVDAYGTAGAPTDTLAKNGKLNYAGTNPPGAGAVLGVFSKATVALKLIGAATGGTAAGNTALTAGTVKCRVVYRTLLPIVDAA